MKKIKPILLALLVFVSSLAFAMSALEEEFEHGDPDVFMARATELAEQGDAEALFLIGKTYDLGKGALQVDLEKAERYYLAADQKGSARASNNLGNIYLKQKKKDEAIALYKKSIERGLVLQPSRNLARVYDLSSEENAELFPEKALIDRAKLAGDYYAQAYEAGPSADLASNAGRCYLWVYLRVKNASFKYFESDEAYDAAKSLALAWLQKAMDAGDPVAWTNYGSYLRQLGSEKEAWDAFAKGAEGDVAVANFHLGLMLEEGFNPDGMKLDYQDRDDLTLAYYEKAALKRLGPAMGATRRLLIKKYQDEKDERKLAEGTYRLQMADHWQYPVSDSREYRTMVERLHWIREARETKRFAPALFDKNNKIVKLKACGLGENDPHNKAYGFNYGEGFELRWDLVYYFKVGKPIYTGVSGVVDKDGCATSGKLSARTVKAMRDGAWFGLVVPNSVLGLDGSADGGYDIKLVLTPPDMARGELQ